MKQLIFVMMLFTGFTSIAVAQDKAPIEAVLDSLHSKASEADFTGYFSLYAPDAVFIGTDASEVWTVDEFKAYAKPHFDKGTGWTYHPTSRHIYFSQQGNVAWFDELLSHERLGETRGTGVLELHDGAWKVAQYHLTIPMPNALANSLTEQINTFKASQ